ncbi:MAG: glycoside hydrolase family 68 protein [Ligilactobacillus murinus]|nr:glycoside hydrolase family 68 protein [Ligilactobacillus murinus]
MKDTIVRKKMYKSGKNWVVASVAVAAMVAGSAKVSADQTVDDSASKEAVVTKTEVPETTATYTLNEENTDKGLTQAKEDTSVAASTDTTPVTKTTTTTDVVEASKVSEPAKDSENTVAKDDTKTNATKVASSLQRNDTKASTTEDKASEKVEAKQEATVVTNTTEPKAEKVATTVNDKGSENLAKLNDTAKKVAKEANLDYSKLTDAQIDALNKVVLTDGKPAGTKMTYKNFDDIVDTLVKQDPRYAIPYFNASQIKNMPAAHTRDAETGKEEELEIWDSWPVQDAKTGYVSNWNGYQLVVAMMGIPKTSDSHLYLLYNKYGDNNFDNWKNAGSIFGYNETPLNQQWSGSATVNSDGTIQLYYTRVNTADGSFHQTIATTTVVLSHDDQDVKIERLENDHALFDGDDFHYQSHDQWDKTRYLGPDNTALRDAHIVEDNNGGRYLVFEASTGNENYQGQHQIYNMTNYGGDMAYNVKSMFDILNDEDMKTRATWANAAIGILKLDDNEKYPQVEKLYTPLISANMVSDEIERPNVVKLGDKYYLFAATRLNHGTNVKAWTKADQTVGDNVLMVGYVSDELTGGYKPLNGSGVVLTASVPANWRTATYSYYAVPVEGYNDRVLVTAYMTNRGEVAGVGKNATLAPSFLVQINPDGTTEVLAKMTNQGDWIWDDGSEKPEMMGDINTAALPGEKDRPVDWNQLYGYGLNLKPHQPKIPSDHFGDDFAETPGSILTPIEDMPSRPVKPTQPSQPGVPTNWTKEPTKENLSRASVLPQTGEKQSPVAAVLAGMSAIMMGLGLSKTKKRDN